MGTARPIAAGVSVLVALGLCIDAWRHAESDSIVIEANHTLESAPWRASPPSLEAWLQVRNQLLEAERLAPRSPLVHESLGVLHGRRASSREFLTYARDYFVRALELRPTSPYTWANYAESKYLLGETGGVFENALVNAGRLGPWEPEVQLVLADVGLAMLREVKPPTREAILSIVALGMHRNPLETLRIAEKRGRLDVACRQGELRTRVANPKWAPICQKGKTT